MKIVEKVSEIYKKIGDCAEAVTKAVLNDSLVSVFFTIWIGKRAHCKAKLTMHQQTVDDGQNHSEEFRFRAETY
jgi:hypothetical protein